MAFVAHAVQKRAGQRLSQCARPSAPAACPSGPRRHLHRRNDETWRTALLHTRWITA